VSSPTWLDRAIGWVSPKRGFERVRARLLMQTLGYEGARSGRRTQGWITASTSADAELDSARSTLRNRARDLVRNNPYAARAIEVKVANTIGTGILAEIDNRRLADLWTAFVDQCDVDGKLDFYGIQSLCERTRFESGEVLVRMRPDEGPVPLRLQVLEPDYIDDTRHGERTRSGIEFDALGRPVAYWLYRQHPGDRLFLSRGLQSERVPASEIIHLFRRLRPGQNRGVSDFSPVILRMRDLDDYDDAEIMRKKVSACLAAFVTTPGGTDAARLGPVTTDAQGRVESLYPGQVEYLATGEQITFSEPKDSGGYGEFQRFGLRALAAGCGVPYELMTGDLSQVNYSSYRAGLVDFRRRVETDQWQIHIPFCMRVAAAFQTAAQVMQPGLGSRAKWSWTPPRFELIDPLKETQADTEAVQSGFESWPEVVRRRGYVAQEQLAEIAKWQQALDDAGVIVKSDFRQAKGAGSSASAAA
jgi:lambda family phage portal protein